MIGIDIGGTKCAVAYRDKSGGIRQIFRCATAGPDQTLAALAGAIEGLKLAEPPIIGISAGTLTADEGTISDAPNLPDWNQVPIADFFRRRFGGSVKMMNDAKACALAEWKYGAGRGCRHLAFLTAGTGMGAGLILNGSLYLGLRNAGEVGHLRLAPDGPPGYGKRGSFEGFCSGGGIGRWAQEMLREEGRTSGFGCASVEQVTAAAVAAAAAKGDAEAIQLLARAGNRLGEALAILIDLLNLERIILGSVYVRSRQWLEPAMRQAIAREALPRSAAACEILPSALGEEIGNYGAVAVAEFIAAESAG